MHYLLASSVRAGFSSSFQSSQKFSIHHSKFRISRSRLAQGTAPFLCRSGLLQRQKRPFLVRIIEPSAFPEIARGHARRDLRTAFAMEGGPVIGSCNVYPIDHDDRALFLPSPETPTLSRPYAAGNVTRHVSFAEPRNAALQIGEVERDPMAGAATRPFQSRPSRRYSIS